MKTSGSGSSPRPPPDWLKTLVKSGNPVNVMFIAEVSIATPPGPWPDVPQLLVLMGQWRCRLGEKHEEAVSVLICTRPARFWC